MWLEISKNQYDEYVKNGEIGEFSTKPVGFRWISVNGKYHFNDREKCNMCFVNEIKNGPNFQFWVIKTKIKDYNNE